MRIGRGELLGSRGLLERSANGGDGVKGYTTGATMAGVVIVSLVLGLRALESLRSGGRSTGLMLAMDWLFLFAVVVATSIGFIASNRVEVVGSKREAIEKAERASAERTRLTNDLRAAQQSPVGNRRRRVLPTNRSHGASKVFCDVAERRHGIQAANEALNA